MLNENILSALIVFSSGMFISYFGQSNIISLLGIYVGLLYIILIGIISKSSKRKIENFSTIKEQDIDIQHKKINILFFFAPWCPYSQKALPLWKKIQKVFQDDSSKRFILVNSEEDIDNLIQKYEIKSYPIFMTVDENNTIATFHNDRTVENLSKFIENNSK